MVIEKLPGTGKRPEEDDDSVEILDGRADPFKQFNKIKPLKFSVGARVFFVFAAFIISLWAAYTTFITLLVFVCHILTFKQVHALKKLVDWGWKQLRLTWALSLGLFVLAFSPTLGFAVLLTYFFTHLEDTATNPIFKAVSARFKDQFKQ